MKQFPLRFLAAAILFFAFWSEAGAGTARPTVAITSPTTRTSATNADFTATGTAGGGAGVTNVLYSFNGGAWTNAASGNHWTNWSAGVTLKPGTNFFSACAQDAHGVFSATNKVAFFYVVLATMTVNTNGNGVVTPNYNGAPLKIGVNYSMTGKSPVAGFGLQSWTDASNNIITNGATVKFLMVSNLVLTANFGDVQPPVVKVTSLTTNVGGNPASLIVHGTASDNVAVTNVQYSLNGGTWTNATATGTWSNWTAQVTMVPGTNTVVFQAVDSSGNLSSAATAKSFLLAYATLTVRTNGVGIITPSYDGVPLKIGVNYSMTAKSPVAGSGLQSWTDGSNNLITTRATVTFLMTSNLTLVANLGDVQAPKVYLSGVANSPDGVPGDFVVRGTANDNVGVSQVLWQTNNGPWNQAVSTNHFTNWTAMVTFPPGDNKLSIYALDTSSNRSQLLPATISYYPAPTTLAGMSAVVSVDSTNNIAPFTVAFGKGTFSESVTDTNNVNGVGSYTYSGGGTTGTLKIKYLAPPSATAEGSQTLALFFSSPAFAYFTNTTVGGDGVMQFSAVSNLPPASIATQQVVSVSGQGTGTGVLFQNGKYVSQPLAGGGTNTGSYTYTVYSPLVALFKLVNSNATSYYLASFSATNYGSYYSEDYDAGASNSVTDNGRFLFASQKPGGNAPASLTNENIQVVNADGAFNLQFGVDTYGQDTSSTNYDNDVGSYTYAPVATNAGQLNLTVTAPPSLAGTNSAAQLVFVTPGLGWFTNADGTASIFQVSAATNFAPVSVTNATLGLNYFDSFFGDTVVFTNGQFTYNGYPWTNYSYQAYAPGCGMMILDFGTNGMDWLQLNFQSTNSGNFYFNFFDTSTNATGNEHGTFNFTQ
jgi:hypothetical protein